jgi:hypothetical protein
MTQLSASEWGDARGPRPRQNSPANRQRTARAIVLQLRRAMASTLFRDGEPGSTAAVGVGGLQVWFARVPAEGTYFSIQSVGGGPVLMTGFLDPVEPGEFVKWRAPRHDLESRVGGQTQ